MNRQTQFFSFELIYLLFALIYVLYTFGLKVVMVQKHLAMAPKKAVEVFCQTIGLL